MPTTCDHIRPLLSAYQDDTLSERERALVRDHLVSCAACRDVLATYGRLYALLRADDAPIPADLYRRAYPEDMRGQSSWIGPSLGALRTTVRTAGLLAVLAALVLAALRFNAGGSITGQTSSRLGASATKARVIHTKAHAIQKPRIRAITRQPPRAAPRLQAGGASSPHRNATPPYAAATATAAPIAPTAKPTAVGSSPRPQAAVRPMVSDDTSSPSATLRSFYNAIDRHDTARAFGYIGFLPGDIRDYQVFKSGYDDTRTSTLVRIEPANYVNATGPTTTTCVGMEIRATHTDGTIWRFGGWYLLRRDPAQASGWRIVLSQSSVKQNGRMSLPPRKLCRVS